MGRSILVWRVAAVALLLGAVPSCGGNSNSDSGGGKASANEKSLFLVGVLDREPGACTATADRGSTLLARGVLDLAFSSSYSAVVLVGNQFQSAASTASAPQTERVALSAAQVSLATASGRALGMFMTAGTGFIDAAADSSAYGVMAVTIVPAALAQDTSLQGKEPLVATIEVEGQALDGTVMVSSELTFPIDVCTGCLVQYPLSAADPTQPAGASYRCTTFAADSGQTPAPPCVLGQDTAFSCVLCSASYEICRDPAQNPAYQ